MVLFRIAFCLMKHIAKRVHNRLHKAKEKADRVRSLCLSHLQHQQHKAKKYCHHHIGRRIHHVRRAVTFLGRWAHTLEMCILAMGWAIALLAHFSYAWPTQIPENTSLIYPLKQVSTITCRTMQWDIMPESCKIDMPHIEWANYDAYKNNKTYRDIYTALWWAPYTQWWDQTSWSHGWVDLATAGGTPLYAVADAIVTEAGEAVGYGNVVKIKFLLDGVVVHAVYGHMQDISVSKGDKVSQWEMIWTVGNSGMTFGGLGWYHVHFELVRDYYGRAKYHFNGCPDLTKNMIDIVNQGLCRTQLEENSYDPIALIEHYKLGGSTPYHAWAWTADIVDYTSDVDDRPSVHTDNIIDNTTDNTHDTEDNNISDTVEEREVSGERTHIVISGTPVHNTSSTHNTTAQELSLSFPQVALLAYDQQNFLSTYDVTLTSNRPLQGLGQGDIVTLTLRIRDAETGENFSGVAPSWFEWLSHNNSVSFDISTAHVILDGTFTVQATMMQDNPSLQLFWWEDIIY